MPWNFRKPLILSEMPELVALSEQMKTHIERNWSDIRASIDDQTREKHVASLKHKLDGLAPGFAAILSSQVPEMRKRALLLTLLQNHYEGRKFQEVHDLSFALLYWAHSNDFLERNGLSRSALNKQTRHMSNTQLHWSNWLQFSSKCPACDAESKVVASAVPKKLEYDTVSLECRACGHKEMYSGSYSLEKRLSFNTCECPYCETRRTQIHQACKSIGSLLLPGIVNRVRNEVRSLIDRIGRDDRQLKHEPCELTKKFARSMWKDPTKQLVHLVQEHAGRDSYHPVGILQTVWEFLPSLMNDGLVVLCEVNTVDLSDDQAVLETTLRSRDELLESRTTTLQSANFITTLLRGPIDSSHSNLCLYLAAIDEIGLDSSWFTLPCDCIFDVDRDVVREFGSDNDPASLTTENSVWPVLAETPIGYLHLTCRQATPSYWYASYDPKSYCRELEMMRSHLLKLCGMPGLGGQYKAIRAEFIKSFSSEHQRVLLEDLNANSPQPLPIDEIVNHVRSNGGPWPGINGHNYQGKALSEYLYWRLCRDVVDGPDGVPRGWIMAALGTKKAAFDKSIRPVSMTFTCPKCGEGCSITELRFGTKEIELASLHCNNCNHEERRDVVSRSYSEYLVPANGLVCACTACRTDREAALERISIQAPGVLDRVVDHVVATRASEGKVTATRDLLRQTKVPHSLHMTGNGATAHNASHGGLQYAMLREHGHSPKVVADRLFRGIRFREEMEAVCWQPAWLFKLATRSTTMSIGKIEEVSPEQSRSFIASSLLKKINSGLSPEDARITFSKLEQELASRDLEKVLSALSRAISASSGTLFLGWRAPVFEVPQEILSHADDADLIGLEPSHIMMDEWGPHQLAQLPPLQDDTPPEWPHGRSTSGGGGADIGAANQVQPRQRELEALSLLQSLGYVVVPPSSENRRS